MRLELTRRGDYAVRAMLLLARTDQDLLPSDRIAEAMSIPARFMRAVMRDLHQAGLVEAVTGRAGGYRLARLPERISLLDVVEAIEGDSRRQTCVLRGAPCGRDGFCDLHAVFFDAQEALLARFADVSLAVLRDRGLAVEPIVASEGSAGQRLSHAGEGAGGG
jgi:Rrf2 family protein